MRCSDLRWIRRLYEGKNKKSGDQIRGAALFDATDKWILKNQPWGGCVSNERSGIE